jgi:hypothetical protein
MTSGSDCVPSHTIRRTAQLRRAREEKARLTRVNELERQEAELLGRLAGQTNGK